MAYPMADNIKWLGHAGFEINTGEKIIVIDPFQIKDCKPADILLITHPHYDHCSKTDIEKIIKPDTIIVTDSESAKNLSGDVRIVKPGDRLTLNGVQVEAVAAYNINKSFHPKNNNWLGFIINVNEKRIYHAGDTDLIPEMDNFEADIALLPVSGTYVMTAEEAIEAARKIKPEIAIPMHYDSIVGSEEDAAKFKTALKGTCEVMIG